MANSKNHNWLVSFGDMLTLLLCFFIATLSLSPLGKETTNDNAKATNQAGIDIANPTIANKIRMLEIDEADLSQADGYVLADLKQRLETQVDPAVYRIEKLRIETCFSGNDIYEGQSWHVSMNRALALRSQLIDANVIDTSIGLRSVGPWCELLGEYERDKQIAARLFIEIEKI